MKKYVIIMMAILITSLSACSSKPEEEVNPLDNVYSDLTIPVEVEEYQLPTELDGVTISWTSNIADTLTDGEKTVQGYVDQQVSLTALLEYNEKTRTKLFDVTILATDQQPVGAATLLIEIIDNFVFDYDTESEDLVLPSTQNNATISWVSSHPEYISNSGEITQPDEETGNIDVYLIATFTFSEITIDKAYRVTVLSIEDSVVIGDYTGYYEGANGLTGNDLKSFLHNLIDDHTELSYGDLRDALQDSDEDPNNPNNIILLYTGNSVSSNWDSGSTWNREHVWPRSKGDLEGAGGPAFSDMHHLRPADPSVNSSRGNLDFDNGGTLVSRTTDCYKDSDSFEPRDEVKGDVARMIFYMAVRYEGGSGELDLEISEQVDFGGPYIGVLSVLIQWHLDDLPDEFEMNRNDVIYSYQGNRNPFIDHPEFVELIWGTN